MKERLAGFVLMCALVPMTLIGYLILWWVGIFGPNSEAVRVCGRWIILSMQLSLMAMHGRAFPPTLGESAIIKNGQDL